jgi:hypothetical protein
MRRQRRVVEIGEDPYGGGQVSPQRGSTPSALVLSPLSSSELQAEPLSPGALDFLSDPCGGVGVQSGDAGGSGVVADEADSGGRQGHWLSMQWDGMGWDVRI